MTATSISNKAPYVQVTEEAPPLDALRRFFINLYNWKTRWAVNHLRKAMKEDPDYRHSWLCNIAMPIYDATRPQCICLALSEPIQMGSHSTRCEMHAVNTIPRRYECREMSIEQANHIAERLMKHLFDV